MRFVGQIVSICGRRTLVVRCDPAQLPRLNTDVVDRRLKQIGKLVDVFGNVEVPYATVICSGPCSSRVGEKLFAK